ncbi:MAG: Ig-like domain-containing protein, partial [Bacteroidales bacterium]|nr:Ig-like domain-containing protein [Bacteroidales bacterium]
MYKFLKNTLPMMMAIVIYCVTFGAHAQSLTPGNTPYTVEYWLRADNLSTLNDLQIAQWTDVNGKVFTGNTSVNTAGSAPKMKYDGMNFNPAVNFSTPARRMVSSTPLTTDATRSYLTFYVSKTNLTGTTAGAVFGYRTNHDEGWVGTGTGVNNLYYYNGTITNFPTAQGLSKGHGITGFHRNNGATTATAHHNAKPIALSTANSARNIATGSGASVIGTRSSTGTGTPFYGDIQEIIALSTPVGTPFQQADIQKINSYLAIKYGQSLDPSSQPGLYNSEGVVVWNHLDDPNYNNNMFGIARDNATGLYQKQSTNVDDNTLTLFLDNNLRQMSSQNTGILADMTYLILGSNNQNGISPYEHAIGTEFANLTLTSDFFSRRQNRVYKAQLTGPVDMVNVGVKLTDLKAKYVIVSNSSMFLPEATRVYLVFEGNMAYNVEVRDGDFISFVLSSTTPGGVSGYDVEFWLKADQIRDKTILPNNAAVDRWENQSEKLIDFMQNTIAARPTYTYNGMNFNPAVNFPTGGTRRMESSVNFPVEAPTTRKYLSFYVSRSTMTTSAYGTVFAYTPNYDEGWYGTNANYMYYRSAGTYTPFNTGLSYRYGITGFERSSATGGRFWHNAKPASVAARDLVAISTTKALIGSTALAAGTNPFIGDIQEIIILSTTTGSFNDADIQKVNSYLAIKYGQTLDPVAQPNLYSANGTVVWDGAVNTGYTNAVFGVARDETTGLYQKQSTSVHDNSLTAFLGGNLYTLSAQNDGTLDNTTYLLFGSNGQTGSAPCEHNDGTAYINYTLKDEFISRQQNRIYKTQLTGGEFVILSFKIENFKANYIMVSDDISFTPSNTRLYPISTAKIANNVTIKDGEYIGFAMSQKVPGGVGNYTVEFWLKANEVQNNTFLPHNANVALWENHAEIINNFAQNNTTFRPRYTHDGMNFHPALNFSGGARRMESETTFTVQAPANRIYRSFYVTRSTSTTTTNATVFAYGSNYDEGWNNSNASYLFVFGTAVATANPGFAPPHHGITGFNRSLNMAYHNAKTGTLSAVRPLGASNIRATIGTRGPALATYPFVGDIQEIIILSTPPGVPFNDMDMRKITSYLAIKYGQTLDTIAQPHLYRSDEEIVWNGTTNLGYNRNVFGIARDEITGLYQRQSTSVDDNAITLFLGNVLYTLNELNQGRLNNETYLLLGSNGKNGITPYPVDDNTQFDNKLLSGERFNNRQDRIYKTQLTGDAELLVSIKMNKFTAAYVMVSNSTNFTPEDTRLYPIFNGVAQNVALADGEYIGFALDETVPGGVTDYALELWLKADRIRPGIQPSEDAPIINWSNQSGTIFDFAQSGSSVPTYKLTSMNYQPAVRFASGNRLVSEENFKTEAYTARLYRSFYVTHSSVTGNNYGSVFAYRDNFSEGWYGTNANYLYINDGTAVGNYSLFNPNSPNLYYGITGFDRGTTGTNAHAWHNAKQDPTLRAARPFTTSAAVPATIGTRGPAQTTNPFIGDIQEIIILSTPAGVPFEPVKIAKINTYLAVKYGQMLDTAAHPVWMSSNDVIIWDVADHPGYNSNIFGIGRDEATGLYQKQSMSVGSREKITIFIGNDIKPSATNSQNNGMLTDGFFFMLGSNGKIPNNASKVPYAYSTGDTFANDTLTLNLEFRHSTVLKANITGATSFAPSLYLGGINADYVLVGNDPTFSSPLSTRIHLVDANFVVSNILINQGDYIGFAYHQKTPGGVGNNLIMWLKADEPSTIDVVNGETQEWRDFGGNSNDIFYYYNPSYSNQRRPGFRQFDPDMNFHPSVDFRQLSSGTAREFLATEKAPFPTASPTHHTMIIMTRISVLEAAPAYIRDSYFMGFGPGVTWGTDTRRPAIGFTNRAGKVGGRAYQYGDGAEFVAPGDLFKERATSITMLIRNNTGVRATSYFKFEADAHVDSISAMTSNLARDFVMATSQQMNNKGTLGAASTYDRAMIGTISEVIFYDRVLDQIEKDRIYSYLGLKYGVTLDRDKDNQYVNFDYFLSDGTVVWAGNSNPLHQRYHNNVAAIVRDDAAKLNNLQSHSTDIGSAILMGIGQRLGVNHILTGLNTDKEVIIWGHNGGDYNRKTYPPEEVIDPEVCGAFTEVLGNKIWMVDVLTQENYPVLMGVGNHGFNGDINESFPYGAGWDVTLLIADSEQKLIDLEWDYAIPGVWTDKLHHFNVILEAGKTYFFTFGAKKSIGDCDYCDVENRFNRITFTTKTWKNGWTSADFTLNNRGFNANVSAGFEGTSARFVSNYPRVTSNTLNLRRSRSVTPIMRTVVELDTAAMASFDIRGIGRYSSRLTNVHVYGECGAGIVLPMLNYATEQKSSFYTINRASGTATGNSARPRGTANATNRKGWMYVDFDDPVQKILIDHTLKGRGGNVTSSIFLGPISFACPAPPPRVNEDGLSFTQQAMPQELRLCEVVTYTWRILNTNCNEKQGDFSVTLPPGMLWERNSLGIDDVNIEGASINDYSGNATLTIGKLTLLPGETTIFRARAYFEMTAIAGEYSNRARFDYETIENSNTKSTYLLSCDRMSAGCVSTVVVGLPTEGRMEPLEVVYFIPDKSCYEADDIIQALIVIKNNNWESISQASLVVSYNEEFIYQPGSVSSNFDIGVPEIELDEDTGLPTGELIFSGATGTGFTIPSGEHSISFRLIAPSVLEPDYDEYGEELLDESGYPVYAPLFIAFEFETLSEEDDCSASVFFHAYDEIEIEALPEIRMTETTICAEETSQLSRWIGGTWTSNNPDVATVDEFTGLITGVAAGTTTFTFELEESGCIVESGPITVMQPEIFGPDVVYVGIPETFLPNEDGEWESSNTAIATITQDGIMTGWSVGMVNITFTDSFGCSDTKEIEVLPSFTVTYKHNIPVAPAPDVVVDYAANDYTIADCSITFTPPFGYMFTGWNTEANGSGTSYEPGQLTNITENTILYAKWGLIPERYKVYKGTYAAYLIYVDDEDALGAATFVGNRHWLADAVKLCEQDMSVEYTIVLTGGDDEDMTNKDNTYPTKPF